MTDPMGATDVSPARSSTRLLTARPAGIGSST